MAISQDEADFGGHLTQQGGCFALAPSVLASAQEERRDASNSKSLPLRSHRLSRFVQIYSIRARKSHTQRSIDYVNRRQQGCGAC
jgi:hypothetical protein